MKVVRHNHYQIVLRPDESEVWHRAFIWKLSQVARPPRPKLLRIENESSVRLERWEMSWKKFGQQTTIGALVLIDKDRFKYSVTEK